MSDTGDASENKGSKLKMRVNHKSVYIVETLQLSFTNWVQNLIKFYNSGNKQTGL